MKKHIVSNLIFTVCFLVIFSPLCFLLYTYILHYGYSSEEVKEPLSKSHIQPVSANRDFSGMKEHADKVTVLTYHQIIPSDQLKKHHFTESGELAHSVVTLEQFTEQMNYLKEHNYTVLSLREFESFMTEQKKVPAKSVLITFDDGYKNVFKFAYPVLKKDGFYAVHFLITGMITEKTAAYNSPALQYASIDELLEAADVFDYENHTHSFHQKNDNGESYVIEYSAEEVKKDIAKARKWLGSSIAFAAPYGEYNSSTLKLLKELDIKMAFTIEPGYAEPSQHILEIPRQGIYPFYTIKDFKYLLEQSNDSSP